MLKDLQQHAERFNSEKGEECVKMGTVEKDFVVAICTPLMKRVHTFVEHSGELVFVDASGGVDRHHCRIFLLLTHSAAGGLPLGCLITTSESKDVISSALELFKEVMPKNAFYGRGTEGPQTFMTDDSTSERNAIGACFPKATLLLCVFHLLQANWRYLWEAKHAIRKEHRPHLLGLVKSMVYASNSDELQVKYNTLTNDETAVKYTEYLSHLAGLFDRRNEWALCLREDLPTRGNNTNNYVEAAMRVLKDKVFFRVRAFNVVQLLDFSLTRLEAYYERRLIDIANNRLDMTLSRRFLPSNQGKIDKDMVIPVGGSIYSVCSETKQGVVYSVDMSMGLCSCYVGNTGAPCKHQYAIVKHYNVESLNFVPVSSPMLHNLFYQVATGCTSIPNGWFQSLRAGSSSVSPTSSLAGNLSSQTVQAQSPVVDEMQVGNDIDTTGHDQLLGMDSLQQQRELQNRFLMRDMTNVARSNEPHSSSSVFSESERVEKVKILIKGAAEDICHRLEKNPSLLASAEKFVKMSGELTTDSALESALACFGRYTGVGVTKCTISKGKVLQHGSKIGVQPTAIARRKSALGGRRCLITGRKTKSTTCPMKVSNKENMIFILSGIIGTIQKSVALRKTCTC